MRIVKLNAIPSTNDYLKMLSQTEALKNFCCCVTENQTQGRGQMGAQWLSEQGKNLTFSVYIEKVIEDISQIYLLNVAVAVSIFKVLNTYKIPKLSIKWPNDIMADTKKIGGILIENSIRGDGSIVSIVGIGINVNQMNFEEMPSASSMAATMSTFFDKEILLENLLEVLKTSVVEMNRNSEALWSIYKAQLFKKDVPAVFEDSAGNKVMGIIRDVSSQGLLIIEHEDDHLKYYNIKEIKMLY